MVETRQIPVLEMSCAACAVNVENVVRQQPGVNDASVNYANENLQITYDPSKIKLEEVKRAVQSVGYDLVLTEDAPEEVKATHHAANREALRRAMWGAGLLSIPVVLMGMLWADAEWARWASMFISFPVVFGYGLRFFRNAWKQALHGSANMDTLVALSTGIAWLFSAFNTIFPNFFLQAGLEPHVYFEAAAVVVFFILIGKYLEENAKAHTSSALKNLMGKQSKTVLRLENGREVARPLSEVVKNDVLLVRPGDHIPVDGAVTDGEALVDESSISGEAVLQFKKPGDRVFAGTRNQQSSFCMRAEQVGGRTVLSRIIRTVQEAQGSKAPVQKLADRIAAVFVPVVLLVAALTFVVWWLAGSFSIGLLASITVLVIACPCALGLATPTALMAGIGRAAELGILVKNAESLERAKKITDVVLDKTGTLTASRPSVVAQWWSASGSDDHKSLLGALERRSNHPLAAAVAQAMPDAEDQKLFEKIEQVGGKGVSGWLNRNRYSAGSAEWMYALGVVFPEEASRFMDAHVHQGDAAVVCFAENDRLLALIALSAEAEPGATNAVKQLKNRGIAVHLVSGDRKEAVAAIARKTGIDQHLGAALPADKRNYIARLQAQGRVVAMVGDGINDAEALVTADLGIAMGHGADIAVDVADFTLLGADLNKLIPALDLSTRTLRTIRQNLFWAFVYNLVGIPVAAGVLYPAFGMLLNPMVAGGAMALSSVSVVANSLRLRK